MTDPLVGILAAMLHEVAERKAAARAERRANLTVIERPKRRTAA